MGDPSNSFGGFYSRAEKLFNNKNFTDVEVQVVNGRETATFQAHKLFLAMSSPQFAGIFYKNTEDFISPKSIKIFDYAPHIVDLMLRFIYTKKLIIDLNEARQLYTLAKNFSVRSLQEYCANYISKKELNKDNALYMYGCALREKFLDLLTDCQNLVSSNTKVIFESPCFVETPAIVVKDIFSLENLNVESELDVLTAAAEWAYHQCKERKVPISFDNLRESMKPFFIHLRFLSLSIEEFYEFVQNHHNILNASESSCITAKLIQPNSLITLPTHICTITRQRRNLPLSSTSVPVSDIKESHVTSPNSSSFGIESLHIKNSPLKTISPISKSEANSSMPFNRNSAHKQSPIQKVAPQIIKIQHKTFDFSLCETEKVFSTAFNNDVKSSVILTLLKGAIVLHGIQLKINQESNLEETFDIILNISIPNQQLSESDVYNENLKNSLIELNFNQSINVYENNTVEIEVMIEDLTLNRCCIIQDSIYQLKDTPNIIASVELKSNQINQSFFISRLIYSTI